MNKGHIFILVIASVGFGALFVRHDAPWVLQNVSQSSPLGLYIHTEEGPEIGAYLAFYAHGPGFERITNATGLLMPTVPMLKRIIAGPGDHVCYLPEMDSFRINHGPDLGIQDRVFQGKELPLWRGCRALGGDEWFVHSDRIRNSLDSRFYGPVRASTIVGTYAPLWIEPEEPESLLKVTSRGIL